MDESDAATPWLRSGSSEVEETVRQPGAPLSRLHHLCSGLMEACWLAAIVLVPIAYNPHVFAGFQPFKMAVVRAIAFLLAGAWIVRAIEGRKAPSLLQFRFPKADGFLWGAIGVLVLAYVISTFTSVNPAQSFWGFYPDRRGTLSFLSELVIFTAAAANLRSREQMERLAGAIILPTIPIGLFAIAQRLGLNPLGVVSQYLAEGRMFSLAGHPIFLAAHMGMVVPFTLSRMVGVARAYRGKRRALAVSLGSVILILQLAAILLSQSRGALLATLASVAFFVIAVAAWCGRRALLIRSAVVAAIAVGFLGLLNLPASPLASLRRLPYLDRLATAVPIGQEPDRYRTSLWPQAPRVILGKDTFVFPDGRMDSLSAFRCFIGFGAENVRSVLPQFWANTDLQLRIEKNFHNWFWDAWFGLGALGAGALLALFGGGVAIALRQSGFSPPWRTTGIALLIGTLLCAILVVRFGAGYFGLGISLGMGAALGLIPLVSGILPGSRGVAREGEVPMVLAAAAALVAHLVESAFAFPVASTSLLFWMCLALVIANGREPTDSPSVPIPAARAAFWSSPLLAGLLMAGLIFAFVSLRFASPMSWWEILSITLTRVTGSDAPSHLLSIVFLPTAVIVAGCAAFDAAQRGVRPGITFTVTLLGALLLAGLYAAFKSGAIAAIGPISTAAASVPEAIRATGKIEALTTIFFLFCGMLIVLLGVACSSRADPRARAFSRRGLVTAILITPAILFVAKTSSLRFVDADASAAWADVLLKSGAGEPAFEVLQRTIRQDPRTTEFRMTVARESGCLDLGAAFQPGAEMLARVDALLREGWKLSKSNELSYALGKLYFNWTLLEPLLAHQTGRAKEARAFYAEALRYDPKSDLIWMEAAMIDGFFFRDLEAEKVKLAAAVGLVPPEMAAVWGNLYLRLSLQTAHPIIRQRYTDRGFLHFQRAIDFATGRGEPAYAAHFGKGVLFRNLDQHEKASAEFQIAIGAGGGTGGWQAEEMLARTLDDLGDRTGALQHLEVARTLAPNSAQQELDQLKHRFQSR